MRTTTYGLICFVCIGSMLYWAFTTQYEADKIKKQQKSLLLDSSVFYQNRSYDFAIMAGSYLSDKDKYKQLIDSSEKYRTLQWSAIQKILK